MNIKTVCSQEVQRVFTMNEPESPAFSNCHYSHGFADLWDHSFAKSCSRLSLRK